MRKTNILGTMAMGAAVLYAAIATRGKSIDPPLDIRSKWVCEREWGNDATLLIGGDYTTGINGVREIWHIYDSKKDGLFPYDRDGLVDKVSGPGIELWVGQRPADLITGVDDLLSRKSAKKFTALYNEILQTDGTRNCR